MKLIATAFVTVDGVVDGPGFDEHRDGKNAWALRVQDEEAQAFNMEQAFSAAARALSEAGGGQVVVTRTVRDLATGTDLAFASLGSIGLRGVPGGWELFEASLG